MPEQAFDGRRHRELRCRTEASFGRVVHGGELLPCVRQQRVVVLFEFVLELFQVREYGRELLAVARHFVALGGVAFADAHQQVGEAG